MEQSNLKRCILRLSPFLALLIPCVVLATVYYDDISVSSITTALTANRAVTTNGSSVLAASATTATELGFVSGVTSAIQTQINGKQATGNYITALTGDVTASGPGSVASTVAKIQGTTVSGTTGTTNVVFSGSPTIVTPTITTSATVPLIIGGTGTTSTLTLRPTSGVGTTNADMIFQVGNNGATEAMRILNSGSIGIGTASPVSRLTIYDAAGSVLTLHGDSLTQYSAFRYSTDSTSARLNFRKSRGSVASPSALASADSVGSINFQGFGGTTTRDLANIQAYVDTFTSDTNISSYLTFSTSPSGTAGAVEKVRIDQGGNVGIATTSPAYQLDVVAGSTTVARLTGSSGSVTSNNTQLRFAGGKNGELWSVGTDIVAGNGSMDFHLYDLSSAAVMTLQRSTGNVGIGTTSPTYQLDVQGATGKANIQSTTGTNPAYLAFNNTGGAMYIGRDGSAGQSLSVGSSAYAGVISVATSHALQFGTSNTVRATIAASGNMGVGTTGPLAIFHVAGSGTGVTSASSDTANQVFVEGASQGVSQANLSVVSNDTVAANVGGSVGFGAKYSGNSWATLAKIQALKDDATSTIAGALAFSTRLSGGGQTIERMRIDSSGNVGIGTTVPSRKLSVQKGAAGTDSYISFMAGDSERMVIGDEESPATKRPFIVYDTAAAAYRLVIDAAGNVGIGTTGPSTQLHTTGGVRFANFGAGAATFDASGNISSVSDERLKDIQRQFTSGLKQLEGIRPITYKWNKKSQLETEHEYSGFSAQNVAANLPEGVSKNPQGYYSLQDRAIIAALVNAVNELSEKVKTLEAKDKH